MKLDVESLRTLREVVDAGAFTEAAARLGMTQSAVSWKVKRLEERVGAELVQRGTTIEPTADGEDLLAYAEVIIEAHDAAVDRLTRSEVAGTVRLGSNEDLHAPELAKIVARFNRVFPKVHLKVRIGLSGHVRQWLDDDEVDLALLQLPIDEIEPGDTELWREPVRFMKAVDAEIGQPLPVIGFGPGWAIGPHVETALNNWGGPWREVLECPSLAGVQAAVRAGLGVSALNPFISDNTMESWANDSDEDNRLRLPDVSQLIRVAEPSTGNHDDAQRELLNLLADELAAELDHPQNGRHREDMKSIDES